MTLRDSAMLASIGRARRQAHRDKRTGKKATPEQEAIFYLEDQVVHVRRESAKKDKELFALKKKLRQIEDAVLRSRERNATVIGTNLIANILKEGEE